MDSGGVWGVGAAFAGIVAGGEDVEAVAVADGDLKQALERHARGGDHSVEAQEVGGLEEVFGAVGFAQVATGALDVELVTLGHEILDGKQAGRGEKLFEELAGFFVLALGGNGLGADDQGEEGKGQEHPMEHGISLHLQCNKPSPEGSRLK